MFSAMSYIILHATLRLKTILKDRVPPQHRNFHLQSNTIVMSLQL